MALHQLDKALTLAAIEPDNTGEVGELFGAEVVDLACHLTVDMTGVEHQYLVVVGLGFILIEEPQLARHRAGVEEIGADIDHGIHMPTLDQRLTHLGILPPRAGCLR